MAEKNSSLTTVLDILKIQAIICFFSIINLLSKYASTLKLFSFPFCLVYGLILLCFMTYAFFWQKLLKKHSLFQVYANRALLPVYSLVWGIFLFSERVTVYNIAGILIIIVGIIVVFGDDK